MNCKQDDLAIVTYSNVDANLGRVVRILRYFGHAEFKSGESLDDCWLIEGHVEFVSGLPFCEWSRERGADACWPDAWLKPIRNPGADETDEMLLLVGSPNWQEA